MNPTPPMPGEHPSLRQRFSAICMGLVLLVPLLSCGGDGISLSFPSGVASGGVTQDSVTLWTRVDGNREVRVDLYRDASLEGPVATVAELRAKEGIVLVDATGLEPGTRYYYAFSGNGETSDVGTFVTAPPEHEQASLRFAFSGDSNAIFQPFTLLASVAEDDPDFFIYLGDTIYSDDVRNPMAPAMTVPEYDAFYHENREDANLRELLATTAVLPVWDDHEVTNDFAGQTVDPVQMENGLASFFRNFPIRPVPGDPADPHRLYRSFRWGLDIEFFVLDERQYRSGEMVCTTASGTVSLVVDDACAEELSVPGRTFLGEAQETWFKEALLASTARFKFVVSGLPITEFTVFPYDRWEGYPAERRKILDFIQGNDIRNVFFLTTDIHANFVTTVEGNIREIISCPIATDTLREASVWVNFPFSPEVLFDLFFPNIEFFDVNQYAYALVEVYPKAPAPFVRVSIKGIGGAVLYTTEFPAD